MALQNYSKLQHKQHKSADIIFVDYSQRNAIDEAIKMARICQGIWDWQGVRNYVTVSGLARIANLWLAKNNHTCRVYEEQYEDYSIYYPTFPKVA